MTDPGFKTQKEWHIAALLRNRGPLNAAELVGILGDDKKTLKRCLDRLLAQELLDYVASETGTAGRGRPAGLWSLTPSGESAIAANQDQLVRDDNGSLVASIKGGQTWVEALVTPSTATGFRDVIADGELSAAASSIVRFGVGEAQHCLFVFDASVGGQPPDNLQAGLEAIGVSCSIRLVRDVQPSGEFVDSVRTARSAAARALKRGADQ